MARETLHDRLASDHLQFVDIHHIDASIGIIDARDTILHQFYHIGSEEGTLTVFDRGGELLINRGCFTGSFEEFEHRVKAKREDDPHRKNYGLIIAGLKALYPDKTKDKRYYLKYPALSGNMGYVNYVSHEHGPDTITFHTETPAPYVQVIFNRSEAEKLAGQLGLTIGKQLELVEVDSD